MIEILLGCWRKHIQTEKNLRQSFLIGLGTVFAKGHVKIKAIMINDVQIMTSNSSTSWSLLDSITTKISVLLYFSITGIFIHHHPHNTVP